MAQIGTLGSVVFEASSELLRTFRDYKRNSAARLTTHEIIGKQPVTEFLGPGIDSITFAVSLSAFWGVNPKEEADTLRRMMQNGEIVALVIGGAPVTEYKWIIESINETASAHDGKGNIIRSEIEISIHEYIENTVATEEANSGANDR